MSVYTVTFFSGAAHPGDNDPLYTVPPGMVAIVRDIDVVGAWDGVTADIFVYRDLGATIFRYFATATSPWGAWRGRSALVAGDGIGCVVAGSLAFDLTIAGYIFPA